MEKSESPWCTSQEESHKNSKWHLVTTRIVTVINMTWNGRDTCDRTVEEKSSPVIPSRKGKQADQTQTRNSTKVS
jgi:hypothetical protein